MKNKTAEAASRAKIEARAEAAEKAALEAKADMRNTILFNDCLNQYKNALHKSMNEVDKFYQNLHLTKIHDDAKEIALTQVYSFYFNVHFYLKRNIEYCLK